MRECVQRDFGDDPNSIKEFNKIWGEYVINYCPDIKDSDDIYLKGDQSSNNGVETQLSVIIRRCDPMASLYCKSDDDYNNFI